eukprot:jgi/Botrbrau1/15933/Bobra.0253s0008.2
MRNMALMNEVQRLRIENNMYQAREAKIMKLLESVDMVRHAMPNLNLEQQQGMIQDIAVSISNIRNGIDKQSLATERWQKLLPRILVDDWNLTDIGIKNLLVANGQTGAALPIRPSDLKLQMTLYTGEPRIVSVLDVMKWSWRDYHKVYSDYTAEAARLFELHKRGDPGAGLRMAQLLQELRGMFIVFTVVDMRHQRILLMSNMENLSVVPDTASVNVARKCAADLLTTLTAQQKARIVDLHKQYVERQTAIKSRRAQLVPHAQTTLDTDRNLTPTEQVQALEAQGLLQANLDEELENMSLLSYVLTSVILSAFQCAVMCASAYPFGANLPAILEALCDTLLAPPSASVQETSSAETPGVAPSVLGPDPVPLLQPAPAPVMGQPTTTVLAQAPQQIALAAVLQGQGAVPAFLGASLGDANFTGVQLATGIQQAPQLTHPSLFQGHAIPPVHIAAYVQGTTASPSGESEATSVAAATSVVPTATAAHCDPTLAAPAYIPQKL